MLRIASETANHSSFRILHAASCARASLTAAVQLLSNHYRSLLSASSTQIAFSHRSAASKGSSTSHLVSNSMLRSLSAQPGSKAACQSGEHCALLERAGLHSTIAAPSRSTASSSPWCTAAPAARSIAPLAGGWGAGQQSPCCCSRPTSHVNSWLVAEGSSYKNVDEARTSHAGSMSQHRFFGSGRGPPSRDDWDDFEDSPGTIQHRSRMREEEYAPPASTSGRYTPRTDEPYRRRDDDDLFRRRKDDDTYRRRNDDDLYRWRNVDESYKRRNDGRHRPPRNALDDDDEPRIPKCSLFSPLPTGPRDAESHSRLHEAGRRDGAVAERHNRLQLDPADSSPSDFVYQAYQQSLGQERRESAKDTYSSRREQTTERKSSAGPWKLPAADDTEAAGSSSTASRLQAAADVMREKLQESSSETQEPTPTKKPAPDKGPPPHADTAEFVRLFPPPPPPCFKQKPRPPPKNPPTHLDKNKADWLIGFIESQPGFYYKDDGTPYFHLYHLNHDSRVVEKIEILTGLKSTSSTTFTIQDSKQLQALVYLLNGNLILTASQERFKAWAETVMNRYPELTFPELKSVCVWTPTKRNAWLSGIVDGDIGRFDAEAEFVNTNLMFLRNKGVFSVSSTDLQLVSLVHRMFKKRSKVTKKGDVYTARIEGYEKQFEQVVRYFNSMKLQGFKQLNYKRWQRLVLYPIGTVAEMANFARAPKRLAKKLLVNAKRMSSLKQGEDVRYERLPLVQAGKIAEAIALRETKALKNTVYLDARHFELVKKGGQQNAKGIIIHVLPAPDNDREGEEELSMESTEGAKEEDDPDLEEEDVPEGEDEVEIELDADGYDEPDLTEKEILSNTKWRQKVEKKKAKKLAAMDG